MEGVLAAHLNKRKAGLSKKTLLLEDYRSRNRSPKPPIRSHVARSKLPKSVQAKQHNSLVQRMMVCDDARHRNC